MLAAAMTAPERVEPRTVQLPLAEAIVIVTLDGVRWREIFEGTDADLAVPADLPRKSAAPWMRPGMPLRWCPCGACWPRTG